MPIDLTTDKARRQYHRTVLKIMGKLERPFSNALKPMINKQFIDSAKLVQNGVTDIDSIVDIQRLRFRKILIKNYNRVAFTAGREATRAYDPTKSMGAEFWNEINTYVALNVGRKVTQIQAGTKLRIKQIIQKGTEAGETNAQMATRIRKVGKIDSKFRALRIARTETLGMYNSATEASINDTGLEFTRIWSTTKDLRTRRRKKKSKWDHWVVDGQKRKQKEPFLVSGELLMFPGIPTGSAGNIIN